MHGEDTVLVPDLLFHRTLAPLRPGTIYTSWEADHGRWPHKPLKRKLEAAMEDVRREHYSGKPSRLRSLFCTAGPEENAFVDRGPAYRVMPVGAASFHWGDDQLVDRILGRMRARHPFTNLIHDYWRLEPEQVPPFTAEALLEGRFEVERLPVEEPALYRGSPVLVGEERGVLKHRLVCGGEDTAMVRCGDTVRTVPTATVRLSAPQPIRFNKAHVILTYRCPNACSICCTGSLPDRGSFLDPDVFRTFLQRVKDHGLSRVSLSGGEPFIDESRLLTYCEDARRQGVTFSLSTCGHWASSASRVSSTLRRLAGLGAVKISLSTDSYHQVNTPPELIRSFLHGYLESFADHRMPLTIKTIVKQQDDPLEVLASLCDDSLRVSPTRLGEGDSVQLEIQPRGAAPVEVKLHWNGLYRSASASGSNHFKRGLGVCASSDLLIEPGEDQAGGASCRPCCSPGNLSPGLAVPFAGQTVLALQRTFGRRELLRGLRHLGLGTLLAFCGRAGDDMEANNICQLCQRLFSDRDLARRVMLLMLEHENKSELV